MTFVRWTAIVVTAAGFAAFSGPSQADQPKLGFSGTLVQVADHEPLKGYRVDSVTRDSLAAKMGLKRGDIVMVIGETYGFMTHEAYLYALRQQGKATKIGVIRSRDGKLAWLACPLGHNPQPHEEETPPDGVVSVDFAHNLPDAP